ncbi:DUF1254 domain-containing protein [Congregibacter sp.]|uniref:DUF1254 domain-containing protein n=1 Tax=Congregibacter sp. TaxID=2744308 RepID=UPI003859A682
MILKRVRLQLCTAVAVLSLFSSLLVHAGSPMPPEEFFADTGLVVTEASYPYAETARQMIRAQALAGEVNRFVHRPQLTPTADQPVVRMNRDSYYSSAVVDVSQGATVTLPEVPEGKYLSMQPVTEDHRTQPMSYGGGTYQLATHTGSHVYVIVRLDATFSSEEVQRYQAAMRIEALSSEAFSTEPVNRDSFYAVENALKAKRFELLKSYGPDTLSRGMFTAPTDESRAFFVPEIHQVASAAGWGGAQVRDNVYELTPNLPAEGCYQATFEDPGNDAFWSFTVYDRSGFMFDDVANVNSELATPNADGSYTVSLGCDAGAVNRIPIENASGVFNITVRHYRPSTRVIDGYRLVPSIEKIQH